MSGTGPGFLTIAEAEYHDAAALLADFWAAAVEEVLHERGVIS
jgi:hypothetical protein